ncbi:RnfABCDGE type electron transport complex subunit G [Clostridium sp. CX1]|uniref:Ion-translocating oxidoreductase complex subunit G n=1 Tax=Clostridium tanneri TaxID=3037988 RepID=A0ABU4JN65_9CLOT|nr:MULTISPECIES: RnfABCDGE type electron transport complex subunit G [unclassified Clostridium]MCT8976003.1 RnfABCDGE type electron transport complex subunit G [Clostridium sp. CX1]MDW8799555.1 RnfABCDGE type electron transport complex subunit G [Clostridium sp. A1-XYC3]
MSAEHIEKKYSIFQITMNLAAACFISGAIIAAVYFVTNPIAKEKAVVMKNQSMKSLVKDAENFKAIDGKKEWFEAQQGGKTIAYVVPSESKGYGGAIKMLVAVTPQGKVIGYEIISHNETPGLGDNASKDPFKNQFKDKEAKALEVTKDKSNTDNIQAMTGATISSRAVTKAVKEAVEQVVEFAGGK